MKITLLRKFGWGTLIIFILFWLVLVIQFTHISKGNVTEVSLHPPHLIDISGSLTPAALIPFCAYQTNMTLLGQTRQDLPFPVCDQFQPTVLEGQRCYVLDLNSISNKETKSGLKNGLLLLIDPGRLEPRQKPKTIAPEKFLSLNLDPLTMQSSGISSARIYLNTLASFTDFREGKYAMSSLKQMAGTESFIDLPEEKRDCQVQSFETCQALRYVEEVQKTCGCIPWALSSFNNEVNINLTFYARTDLRVF